MELENRRDSPQGERLIAKGVDDEPIGSNKRLYEKRSSSFIGAAAAIYAAFHVLALNGASLSGLTGGLIQIPLLPDFPMETWNFRIVHVAGALCLGFLWYSANSFPQSRQDETPLLGYLSWALLVPAIVSICAAIKFSLDISSGVVWSGIDPGIRFEEIWVFGLPLLVATIGGILTSWFHKASRSSFAEPDIVLSLCSVAVAIYLIAIYGTLMRNSTGTPFAPIGISIAAVAGTLLIMEMTRRVAGLALVIIATIFLGYVFFGEHLPGLLRLSATTWQRFFSQIYSDVGILGKATAVSSTYIILFIIFAAFLQASKVSDYFVNFAFSIAGRLRGGPAKVAIFASGLMGMINGTSAGNVVATGSLTIPLMEKVGYHKKTAGAIEAAASTGGQIVPPIMGAGAFIMAEITGIPYTEIAIAALIPAILYFLSIYFMVDFEAAKLGMRGMDKNELPGFNTMLKKAWLFLPILILIAALFLGYSVIRAGTLAMVAAVVVSWLTPHRVGVRSLAKALELAGGMSLQIIVVCACAGIIIGVISLTGVGARFSNLLLQLAESSQLLALVFAMFISILLGMGMPTTAAYATAASVVAPGLIELGIEPLTAHFFVFYFAVLSAITPPVALAAYAAAGISGANAMETSAASLKTGIAAFVVPFMFFYNGAILMDGTFIQIGQTLVTAVAGVFLLSAGVQGWFLGKQVGWLLRLSLIAAALLIVSGGLIAGVTTIAIVIVALINIIVRSKEQP